MLTTICYRIDNKTTYALEGSIFTAGAGVQWLRDKMKLINNAYDTEKIIRSNKTNDGVYIVPAFTGLGAPYWNANARGVIQRYNKKYRLEKYCKSCHRICSIPKL